MREYPPRRIEPRRRRSRGGTPTSLYVGVGLFVAALLVLGIVLASDSDDEPGDQSFGSAATSTPAMATAPASAPPGAATETSVAGQATSDAVTTQAGTSVQQPAPTETPPEETSEATTEPEQTPPSDDVTETPSNEPTEEPTTEPEPTSGEFGVLPAAEIPSGGLARDMQLQYELGVGLDAFPTDAPVYLLQWPERSPDDVAALAQQLGIVGDVVVEDEGSYRVEGDGGSLFVTPGTLQFVANVRAQGDLEDDASLAATAQAWLLENGLVGPEVDAGVVSSRDDAARRATVTFTTTDPSPLLAAIPSARVSLGPDGVVNEAFVRWPSSYAIASYPLRSGEDVLNAVQGGQGYIEADLSAVPGEGTLTGTMLVTDVTLVYSTAGSGTDREFLVPVIVLSGEAELVEVGVSVPVSVYIAAVSSEAAPAG